MAHEISIRQNGFAELAFAGELPWHGLGNRIDPNATIEEWSRVAGLDWAIRRSFVRFLDEDKQEHIYKDRIVLSRSDTKAPLAVVSDQYKPVQPAEILEFFRDIVSSTPFRIHTAGALRGGRKIWALAKNSGQHTGEASPGDRLTANILLATGCDGTLETTLALTAVRVVCANTLGLALRSGGSKVSVNHRTKFDARTIQQDLAAIDSTWAEFLASSQELARKAIGEEQVKEILRELFGRPAKVTSEPAIVVGSPVEEVSPLVSLLTKGEETTEKEVRAVGKVLELYNGAGLGSRHAGSVGTAWGLLNAVTQYVDHGAGRTQDTRLDSAWFGRGSDIKAQALDLLKAA